ncbi:MAG: PAS domain-containing protein [Desulfamplus sp.]|nr:PAS domain-containing protein [Desulfamplus sp.]
MKNFIKNLHNATPKFIKQRLYLQTAIIAMFLFTMIVMLVWTGNTLTMITAIARFERTHSVSRLQAKAYLLEYLDTRNAQAKKLFFENMDITQSYNKVFSNLLTMRTSKPEKEFVQILESTFKEADHKTSVIIVNRINVLYWHSIVKELVGYAEKANPVGETILKLGALAMEADSKEQRHSILSQIGNAEKDFVYYESSFSKSCSDLANAIASLVNYFSVFILLLSAGFTGLLTYLIANSLLQQASIYARDLEESEERLKLVIKGSSDAPWDWNLITNELYYSPQWWEQIGYSPNELTADAALWQRLIHADDSDRVNDFFQKTLLSGTESYEVEFRLLHKAGHYVPILSRGLISRNNGGKPIRVSGTNMDLSEQKRVEEELRKSKQFNETILNASPDVIYVYDIVDKINIYSNEGIMRVLGYSSAEIKDMGEMLVQNLMHPEDFSNYLNEITSKYQLVQDNEFIEHEYRMKHKNGQWRWLNSKESVFLRKDGKPKQIFGIISDITKKKKLERESLILKTAVNQVPVGIALADENINIYYCNPEGLGVRGGNVDDLVEIPKESFSNWQVLMLNGEPYETDNLPLVKAIKKGMTIREEFIVRHQDGSNRICDATACPIRENNKIIGGMVVFLDITGKKRLEEQLLQSQKMKSISTLAGGIAHDFNNMLSVLIGNVSYAVSTIRKEDELFEILSDALEGAKQAQNLTHQLLTFAKGGEPIKKVCDINALLEETGKFVTSGAKSRFDFKPTADLWTAEIDSGQINQVISNLIINADQAMPNGGIITVKTENTDIQTDSGLPLAEGPYIRITVEDQGIGIQAKHISNIFDPFFTTKQKGSGLGLSTVYSIVKKHNGHITVYSEAGKGTVFNIYLPAILANATKQEEKKDVMHQGKGKVLIMDDQEAILNMVGRLLNLMGYETEFALDGIEAIEKYREAYQGQNPFDLVILDLTIPGGMGGAKTIPELLKIDSNVKAIVSSGYSNDPIMANYEAYGFCGVVPKPYTKAQLSEVLNQI